MIGPSFYGCEVHPKFHNLKPLKCQSLSNILEPHGTDVLSSNPISYCHISLSLVSRGFSITTNHTFALRHVECHILLILTLILLLMPLVELSYVVFECTLLVYTGFQGGRWAKVQNHLGLICV
jgi:hypothetical protein